MNVYKYSHVGILQYMFLTMMEIYFGNKESTNTGGKTHTNQQRLYKVFKMFYFRCAGLCVYEGRGGLCSVRLSLPLLKLRPRKDLVETLLVSMCFSSCICRLFVTKIYLHHGQKHVLQYTHMAVFVNKSCTS
jgi:hypothetical protein